MPTLIIDLDAMPPSAMVILVRALGEAAEFSQSPTATSEENNEFYESWDRLRQRVENELATLWTPHQILRTMRFIFRKSYRKLYE